MQVWLPLRHVINFRKMARRNKEEINEQAKQLNHRCQIFRDSLRIFPGKEHVSVEVEDAVERECKELEDRLHHLQQQRNSLSANTAIDDVERLTAQLALWKQQGTEGVTTDVATTSQLLMELQHVVRQQQALLAITRGTRLSLDQELKREQQLLKESEQMKDALKEKLQHNQTPHNTSHELARKIEDMEDHYDTLTQKLNYFLQTYISIPNEKQPSVMKDKRKRQTTLDSYWNTSQDNQISPEQIIMALIEQTVQNPHDPYLECDKQFAQLLLQVGIVQSHPDNPKLIRMTPFHYQC